MLEMRKTIGEMGRTTSRTPRLLLCLIAWLLVVPLVFGLLPAPALAEAAEQMVEEGVAGQAPAGGSVAAGASEEMLPEEGSDAAAGEEAPAGGEAPATEEQMAEEGGAGDERQQATTEDTVLFAQSDGADGFALTAQSVEVHNPHMEWDGSMASEWRATWDCVWFGSYPQTEVNSTDAVYASLKSADWSNGDVEVDGVRYRRISRDDVTYGGNWLDLTIVYRYFRYEPIKWRVLEVSNGKALVVADVALDCRQYNTNSVGVTWETSSVRSWLNGYFINTAFSSGELEAVPEMTVVNENNTSGGAEGGNNTQDRVYLLSESDVYRNKGYLHGFSKDYDDLDEARRCGTSDYAYVMGTWLEANCDWWLRSPGSVSENAAIVSFEGQLDRAGEDVCNIIYGVRPALTLNLSSDLIHSAGTFSSNWAMNEVGFIPITSVELSETSYTYDGQEKKPAVTVHADGVYVPSNGYSVSYSDNTGAGTATVTVTGKGPYTGSASATFQIARKPVTVTADDKTRTFGAFDPALTATVEGLVGSDTIAYTLSRAEGEDVGDYAITPTGDAEQGNYAVTYEPGNLTITKGDLSGAEIARVPDQTYTGSNIEPELHITLGDRDLPLYAGTDYVVEYTNNKNAGTATATVKSVDTGNCEGTTTKNFTITSKSVTVIAEDKTKTYGADDPAFTANVVGLVGSDTVNYGFERTEGEDVGEYTITPTGDPVQGNGNYAITYLTGELTITKARSGLIVHEVSDSVTCTYSPTADVVVKNNVSVTGAFGTVSYQNVSVDATAAGFLVDEETGAVTVPGSTPAGIYVVRIDVTDPGDANHEEETEDVSYLMKVDPSSEFTVGSPAAQIYTGKLLTPMPTVKDGETVLSEGTDYALSWSNNVNAGTATVTVTGKGNYTGTKSATFQIDPSSAFTVAAPAAQTYAGGALTPRPTVTAGSVTLREGVDYVVSWSNNVNVGIATLIVTGKGNYMSSKSATFKINPAKATPAVSLSKASLVYDGKAQRPAVTVRVGSAMLAASSYTVAWPSDATSVGAKSVKVTLRGNYTGARTVSYTIVPKGTSVSKLIPAKKALTVKWKKQATQTTGYQVQYATSKNFKKGAKTVTVPGAKKTSKKIAKLTSKKTYYVRVRTYKKVGGKTYYSAWSAAKPAKVK